MLISKIAKVSYGCTTFYKLIMVKFSNTTITYSNQIFQSNENNNKEKKFKYRYERVVCRV